MTKTSIPGDSSLCSSRNIPAKMGTLMSTQKKVTIMSRVFVLAATIVKKCKLTDFWCEISYLLYALVKVVKKQHIFPAFSL